MSQMNRFDRLAQADPAVAPLARMQAIALATAEQPSWLEAVPSLTVASENAPLLHEQTLRVDVAAQRGLLLQLAATLKETGSVAGAQLAALFPDRAFEPLAMLAASIMDDRAGLEALAAQAEVDVAALGVVAHVAALPLLLACGQRAAERTDRPVWQHGYCPVCAAYPTLAELRGLARDRVLRCGRCSAGWPIEHDRCPFCDSRDSQVQGYFAAESERESRRAVTCEECHGYLKTVATLGPLTPADLLLRDLDTLELDVAVIQQGYERPNGLGWPLAVAVQPAPQRRNGWFGGWR